MVVSPVRQNLLRQTQAQTFCRTHANTGLGKAQGSTTHADLHLTWEHQDYNQSMDS